MNIEKILNILRAIRVLDALTGKQGSYRLSEVCRWAVMDRTTTWRYLGRMVEWKLLSVSDGEFQGKPCVFYSITADGHQLIKVYEN